MKRVLVIAHAFPPMGGGGVQRTLSFVRHLPSLGWAPTVLTTADPDRYWAQDPSLLQTLSEHTEVVRVSDQPLHRARALLRRALPRRLRSRLDGLIDLPDRQVTWWPYARRAALHLQRSLPFDAIYSTSAPWTDHLVARSLKAQYPQLRWVADYRDPWTQNQTFAPATPLHRRVSEGWERDIATEADIVIANTELNRQQTADAFPEASAKIVSIPNGWEPSEFIDLPQPSQQGPTTIGYAGSFYPGYQPTAFYEHLRGALSLSPELKDSLRVTLCGNTHQAETVKEAGLSQLVHESGYLPQSEALAHVARSHAVLLILPDAEGRSGWVPQKLYIYLRLQRPIIAICPPGEARDILKAAGGRQLILQPSDARGPQHLRDWLQDLQPVRTEAAGFDPDVVARYDRHRLAQQLAQALSPR